MIQTTTGQLDKIIEKRIDSEIESFAKSLTDSISQFLLDNGDTQGTHLYVVSKWESKNGYQTPETISIEHISNIKKGFVAGISGMVKDKMVIKATKELLAKVELLS